MTIDKEKLKELAEAANAVTTDVNITMAVGADPEEVKAVQDYLQQTMPKTILALLAEVERLERFEDWFVRLDQVEQSLAASYKAERDQLKAENEALRKDAERYRWLRDGCGVVEYKAIAGSIGPGMLPSGDKLQAAIDAAMAKEAPHG
ncbi:hypothetical protein [Pseudomonas putida]|jgi:hypothetical protein|uniref:Ead/Ea22-like family protein n=1 Tax=Pseudomonas putida TaxID=303 RepID=A0A9X8EKI8_PSEPU|nr:hypothetical protein [Pseudomonas putida]ROQ53638.1 hypothetical protein EDF85_1402 [Pseudomonas putida]